MRCGGRAPLQRLGGAAAAVRRDGAPAARLGRREAGVPGCELDDAEAQDAVGDLQHAVERSRAAGAARGTGTGGSRRRSCGRSRTRAARTPQSCVRRSPAVGARSARSASARIFGALLVRRVGVEQEDEVVERQEAKEPWAAAHYSRGRIRRPPGPTRHGAARAAPPGALGERRRARPRRSPLVALVVACPPPARRRRPPVPRPAPRLPAAGRPHRAPAAPRLAPRRCASRAAPRRRRPAARERPRTPRAAQRAASRPPHGHDAARPARAGAAHPGPAPLGADPSTATGARKLAARSGEFGREAGPPTRRSPRAFLRMSASWSSIQSPGSRAVTISFRPCGAALRAPPGSSSARRGSSRPAPGCRTG